MENLEQISASGNFNPAVSRGYSLPSDGSKGDEYRGRTFAEQFLEPVATPEGYETAGFTVTICTWRGVPTIDDW